MRKLLTVCLLTALLAACQGASHRTTESMEIKRIRVNDTELAYVEEGRGETVLFVHGPSGDWRTWDNLRPYIAEKYHYVALSCRYHFPNVWRGDGKDYSVIQMAEDVAAFIRALNVGKVHLVGGSYGGRVVSYVALKYPELLRSVVVTDPGIVPPVTAEGKVALADYQKDLAKSAAAAKAGDVRQAAILLFNAVQADPAAFENAPPVIQQRWLDNAKTLPLLFAGAAPPPVTCEELASLKVPVLVMRGDQTRANFALGDEMLLNCLPQGTELALVPNARHMWNQVSPRAGADAILAFIAEH
jgi:pimeloyl-ACP methyl ester carboxylesterase